MPEPIKWPRGTPIHIRVPVSEMQRCESCERIVHVPTHVCLEQLTDADEGEGEE
ncbi:hypothetical protein [Streptomyces litchfieldiae]|uniref:Uncharacterized protein n=1 Tax=Streptomyces litchfieldiae TaxID=3075543 RepID=A0ABU2MN69_9ACTN|nr:hypothetical protein [Streptomyces sp. DSM 44938]MDT0343054.1 hypothetical protein [Streptomyces sp. DSM 44938]